MILLTPETVARFKEMFKKEYGVEYSDDEAWEASHNLVGFFDLLLKMDRKQNPHLYERNSEKEDGVKQNY